LADLVAKAGWSRVGWRNLTGGIVALHRAIRPAG
jgi:demethylmenaquinone methyltransferase / 2-methoxy-6-polyprenyl-1,4-benzoquinol methylase